MSTTAEIHARPHEVFEYLDDLNNIGMHMTTSSMAMMGGKLRLQQLSQNKTGKGAKYRWTGKVLWMPIDIIEAVTEWIPDREKSWSTIGHARMIVMSSYEMHFVLTPKQGSTYVFFEIQYELPKQPLAWIAGKLLARKYAEWCLKRATEDAKISIESKIKS